MGANRIGRASRPTLVVALALALSESFAPLVALRPDVEAVARSPIAAAVVVCGRKDDFSGSEAGGWSLFLPTARPRWRRTSRGDAGFTVTADCGGVDVFLVRVERAGTSWQVGAVAWWRLSTATHREQTES